MTSLPDLGVGYIDFPGAGELLDAAAGLANVVEVEPQTLWLRRGGRYEADAEALERLAAMPQTKLVHGVGFPVGGTAAPEEVQLELFVDVIRRLNAPWASEHLAFNRTGAPGEELSAGFLLPPLQNEAGAAAAVATIRALQSRLPVPFAFETGVNYLRPRRGEMSDGAFAAAIAEEADCGILLDLHNLWANERNGRQRVVDFLAELPLHRVWEVHVAGGFEYEGYWLDAHSGPMPEELIALAREVVPRLPNLHAIIFEILPPFLSRLGEDGFRAQMEELRRLWELRRREQVVRPVSRMARTGCSTPAPIEWQDTLGALVIGREPAGPLADELRADPAIGVFRHLVWQVRAGMIVDNFTFTVRLMMLDRGEEWVRGQLDRYFAAQPPQFFGSDEAIAFGAYLAAQELDVRYLPEVLAFERAALEVQLAHEPRVLAMRFEPNAILVALGEGRLPADIPEGEYEVTVR